jgi:hypothetical protein
MPAARRAPSRKLLVASIGVASMTYVATTTILPACGGGNSGSSFGGEAGGLDSAVGNLMGPQLDSPVGNLGAPDTSVNHWDARPGDSQAADSTSSDSQPSDALQIDDFPVANLAAMPDAGMEDVGSG